MELVSVDPPMDLASMLDSQRELFHRQVDELRRIVSVQCRLTGVNPLSQEMAAGALSINIGKRPRDFLNPKAVKYMQSIFSVKDSVGKKESREISLMCGITQTQVRDYFAGQRSRVRKSIRLSREKALKCTESKPSDSTPSDLVAGDNSEHGLVPCGSEHSQELKIAQVSDGSHSCGLQSTGNALGSEDTNNNGERDRNLSQEEMNPDINLEDRTFLDNIFTLMRKEHTFSGQAKLMEWILQINNSVILYWFLTKGGASILASWLNESAVEEQTSIILIIFKVLCHLPLQKAPPLQLSSILQTVNKLRFYRTTDISNKARFLLSRWSKLLVRSRVAKKCSLQANGFDKESLGEQRVNAILNDETWHREIDVPEEILALAQDCSENIRPLASEKVLRLLPSAACDDSSRKRGRIGLAAKTKERRKVQLVEQPDHVTGRSTLVSRAVPSNISRPLSTDDIQKAKLRAAIMQGKEGKLNGAIQQKLVVKAKDRKTSAAIMPQIAVQNPPESTRDGVGKLEDMNVTQPGINDQKPDAMFGNTLLGKLRLHQIPWRKPPEMVVNASWSLGSGENSKEVEVQITRNRREQEVFYPNANDIPENPKEPWDVEMDFDDSLTPEIPTEQPSDEEQGEEDGTAATVATGRDCADGGAVIAADSAGAALYSVPNNSSSANGNSSGFEGPGDSVFFPAQSTFVSVGASIPLSSQTEHVNMVASTPFPLQVEYASMGNAAPLPPQAFLANVVNSVPFIVQPVVATAGSSSLGIPTAVFPQTEAVSVVGTTSFPVRVGATSMSGSSALPVQMPSQEESKPMVPDLELLAVLLQNPDLVFALTSGQANGITEAQMVVLLDMLKKGGVGLNGISNQSAVNPIVRPETMHPHTLARPEMIRLPSPTPPETGNNEMLLQARTTVTHTLVQHVLGSSRDPVITYVADGQQPRYSVSTAAMPPLVQRDAVPSSSASRTYTSMPSTVRSSSSYNSPSHHRPTDNNFLHREPSPYLAPSVANARESHDHRDKHAASRLPFRSPNLAVPPSPPCLSRTAVPKESVSREPSDFRLTNHSKSQPLPRPSPQRFVNDQSAIQQPTFLRDPPTTRDPLRRLLPAASRPTAAVAPPPPYTLSRSSMDGYGETGLSSRGRQYNHDRFASRSSQSPPMHARPPPVSIRYPDRSWNRERGEAAVPGTNHYLDDDDDYDASRARSGRKMSGWDDDRRDWERSRDGDSSRHVSPGKRRWRERDRRR